MDWKDYTKKAKITNCYPQRYLTETLLIGLNDELTELCIEILQGVSAKVFEEAGDVLWYCSQLLDELSVDVYFMPNKNRTKEDAILFLKKAQEAGKIVKKFRRGDFSDLDRDMKAIEVARTTVDLIMNTYGMETMRLCMANNIEKLRKRAESGTIKGDNRGEGK